MTEKTITITVNVVTHEAGVELLGIECDPGMTLPEVELLRKTLAAVVNAGMASPEQATYTSIRPAAW